MPEILVSIVFKSCQSLSRRVGIPVKGIKKDLVAAIKHFLANQDGGMHMQMCRRSFLSSGIAFRHR